MRVFAGLALFFEGGPGRVLFKVPIVPPRRKRRSAEVRNSLRLFGLLAVLAGVNVYVFFFNRGTAPREVLKPSSTVRAADGADGKQALLKETAGAAQERLAGTESGAPMQGSVTTARNVPAKARPPVPLAPAGAPSAAKASKAGPVANAGQPSGGGPPKGSPGGSPGQDNGTPQPPTDSALVTQESSPEKKFGDSDTLG
jgi:hypothetical protein